MDLSLKGKTQKVNEFFEHCLERFGSMNKNDFEVELFYLLLENGYASVSDYNMAVALKIPESKVKRLRYECSLKHPKFDEEQFKKELSGMLLMGKYRVQNERIQFAIKDKLFREYINDLLMEDGRFADTSFNPNIVSISPVDLLHLLTILNENDSDVIQQIRESIKEGKKELPKSLAESLNEMLASLGKSAVKKLIDGELPDKLIDFTKVLWKTVKEKMNEKN